MLFLEPGVCELCPHTGIEGQVNADLVAKLDELLRQGSHHVGQSAGFGKGNTLRRGKNYMHSASPELGC